jgi:hypothetical protein
MKEEINLTTLFVVIAKSVKSHFLFLAILLIVGGIIGLGSYSVKTPSYTSEAVFESSLLSPSEIKDLVSQLNESIRNGIVDEGYNNWVKIEYVKPEVSSPYTSRGNEFQKNYITLKLTSNSTETFSNAANQIEAYFKSIPTIEKQKLNTTQVLSSYSARLKSKLENNDQLSSEISSMTIQEFKLRSDFVLDELAYIDLTLSELSIFSTVKPFYTPVSQNKSPILFILVGGILVLAIGIVVKAIWNA